MRSDIDRFNDKWIPEPNSGCWIWIATIVGGYGQFWLNDKHIYAHRFSYQQRYGSIPNQMTLDHLCRTRCCVNPNHLEPVTQKKNTLRGTGFAAQNARKTHCKNGHLLSNENIYDVSNRSNHATCRECKICKRERERIRNAKRNE